MLITDWRSKSILLLIYRYISGEAPCARLHMTDRNATAGLQISVKLHQLYSLSYFEMETCHSTVANVTCQLRVYFLATSPAGLNMLDCCLSVYFRQMSVTEQRPVFRWSINVFDSVFISLDLWVSLVIWNQRSERFFFFFLPNAIIGSHFLTFFFFSLLINKCFFALFFPRSHQPLMEDNGRS